MGTEKTQNHLVNAIRNLPRDNALSEVRHHLMQAMNKLEHVNQKRARRAKQQQQMQTNQWQHIPNYGMASPQEAAHVLENINQMIAFEKAKLENIIQTKKQKEDQRNNLDGPDFHGPSGGMMLG